MSHKLYEEEGSKFEHRALRNNGVYLCGDLCIWQKKPSTTHDKETQVPAVAAILKVRAATDVKLLSTKQWWNHPHTALDVESQWAIM